MSAMNDGGTGQRMMPAGRKAELSAFVADAGQVTVAELADRFGVSADTIRRDLDQLDADGLLIRTRGGAMSPSAIPRTETRLELRRREHTGAKEVIGELAASLVPSGCSVMVNGGTTALAFARHLRTQRDLTIATNNLLLPSEVDLAVVRDLYLFGGVVRLNAQATVGPVVFQNGARSEMGVQCDLALVAVGAGSVSGGFSTSNLEEALMMSEMMERATHVGVMIDSSKFGKRMFAQVCELGRPDYVVTDTEPPQEIREELRAHRVEVLYPGSEPS